MNIFDNHQFFMDMCNSAKSRNEFGSGLMDRIRFQFEGYDYEFRCVYKDVSNDPKSYRVHISLLGDMPYTTRELFELEMNFGWRLPDKFFVPEKIDMVLKTLVSVEEIETVLTYMKLTI